MKSLYIANMLMKRHFLFYALLLLVFACNKDDDDPEEEVIARPSEYNNYMPLTIGNSWEYEVNEGGSSRTIHLQLNDFKVIDNKEVFAWEDKGGFRTYKNDVIFWYHNSTTNKWHPLVFFRTDVMGSSRSQDIRCSNGTDRITIDQERLNSFSINEKNFSNVIKVTPQTSCESFPLKGTYYFAPGIGLIKHETEGKVKEIRNYNIKDPE
ncbi:hypothetical protein RCC89_20645 [Cytophagaceae bacterium ABcell3]|nr:hypothetical protein RCC89_20645 [Cytophagaceae bacterium ABcell3]